MSDFRYILYDKDDKPIANAPTMQDMGNILFDFYDEGQDIEKTYIYDYRKETALKYIIISYHGRPGKDIYFSPQKDKPCFK